MALPVVTIVPQDLESVFADQIEGFSRNHTSLDLWRVYYVSELDLLVDGIGVLQREYTLTFWLPFSFNHIEWHIL